MTVKEIRESGILEYYVLGLLSAQEIEKVEGYLLQYPELKTDHLEIQNSLQQLANSTGVAPKRNLEADILKTVRAEGKKEPIQVKESKKSNKPSENTSGGMFKNLMLFTLGALTLLAAWFAFNKNNQLTELQQEYNIAKDDCDSLSNSQAEKIRLYDQLNNPNNRTLNLTPTDNYQETNLLFHFNPVQRQNFIQVKNLPTIAANQAFQLWSLKDGVDPIPLTVFKTDNGFIIPVDFEEGTGTYAITIEAEGGATVPTLTRLIGTIGVT